MSASATVARPTCGARKKRGGRCTVTAVYPNGRCRVHGGATPVGPASPHFIHGRCSKEFSALKGLGEHYERALADPDLLRLDSEIAMVDVRMADLMDKVGRARGAQRTLDGIWPQLEALIEARRKLVDTEAKRRKDLHAMVSVERVVALMAYVADAIRRHVTDRAILAGIYGDLRKVLKPGEEQAS